jgi:hypothetical protein
MTVSYLSAYGLKPRAVAFGPFRTGVASILRARTAFVDYDDKDEKLWARLKSNTDATLFVSSSPSKRQAISSRK